MAMHIYLFFSIICTQENFEENNKYATHIPLGGGTKEK
jgi:hypothetical protein